MSSSCPRGRNIRTNSSTHRNRRSDICLSARENPLKSASIPTQENTRRWRRTLGQDCLAQSSARANAWTTGTVSPEYQAVPSPALRVIGQLVNDGLGKPAKTAEDRLRAFFAVPTMDGADNGRHRLCTARQALSAAMSNPLIAKVWQATLAQCEFKTLPNPLQPAVRSAERAGAPFVTATGEREDASRLALHRAG
jgi:hypothetical protein